MASNQSQFEVSQSNESDLNSGDNDSMPSFFHSIDRLWFLIAALALCLCCFSLILIYCIVRSHRMQRQLTNKFNEAIHQIRELKTESKMTILSQQSSNSTSMTSSNTQNTQNIHIINPNISDVIINENDEFNQNELDNKLPDIEMGQLNKIPSVPTKYLYKKRTLSTLNEQHTSNDVVITNPNSNTHSKSISPPQSIKSMDVDDIEFTKSDISANNSIQTGPILHTKATIHSIEKHKMYNNSSYIHNNSSNIHILSTTNNLPVIPRSVAIKNTSLQQSVITPSMYQSHPIQNASSSQQIVSRPIYQASTMPNISSIQQPVASRPIYEVAPTHNISSQQIPNIAQSFVSRAIYESPPIQNVSLQRIHQSYPVINRNINDLRLSVPVQESMSNIQTPQSVSTELTGATSTEYLSDKTEDDISSESGNTSDTHSSSTSKTGSLSSQEITQTQQEEKINDIISTTSYIDNSICVEPRKSDNLSISKRNNQTMIVISPSIEELMSNKIILPNSDHHKMESSLSTVTYPNAQHSMQYESVTEIKTPDLNIGTVGDVYRDMFGIKNNLSIDSSVLSQHDNHNQNDDVT